MSQVLIQKYLRELVEIKQFTGSTNETVLREAFKNLLKELGRDHKLFLAVEYPIENAAFKHKAAVDGALLHELRQPFGYWEAKDENDDLDVEIEKKFKRGYPQDNIIFEDTRTLVLIQNRQEVGRCDMRNAQDLERFMNAFFAYERPEIAQFEKAVQQFKLELPTILQALRDMIAEAHTSNAAFKVAAAEFLVHCQSAINPTVNSDDVSEMLLQHILTEEIFTHVFNEGDFHRHNNIAKSLYDLEATFFTGSLKKNTLKSLEPYYAAIRASAAVIGTHSEKQKFLKAIYENFYQSYNRKAADRLGVVYTPNEIVRFMIQATDYLLEKNFKKTLITDNVEILDPAAGTGTFICELLEHFKGSPTQVEHKFKYELFANEVAILPYYVANLNIEATYAAIQKKYEEFPNLCFVDTLDNVSFSKHYKGDQSGLDIGFSDENVERIKRQNTKKISVIIGNPPYNAWQENYNQQNANRPYKHIDDRIRATYQAEGTAQNQIALYDMYTRFFRWASDRLGENGVIAMITNRSFLDGRSYDGFRKVLKEEFSAIYIVDLGGDVRTNPKLSGTKHNVFGIQTGVAISFLVKNKKEHGCIIKYYRSDEFETAQEKLKSLDSTRFSNLNFITISPDEKHHWLNLVENDFSSFLPLASKQTKASKSQAQENTIFKLFGSGLKSQRDSWVYDLSERNLTKKMRYFIEIYEKVRKNESFEDKFSIKWDRELDKYRAANIPKRFSKKSVVTGLYRPYTKQFFYYDKHFNGMTYQWPRMWREDTNNPYFALSGENSSKPFQVLASENIPSLDLLEKTQCLSLYRFDAAGNRADNITDWGLAKFVQHYGDKITKEGIFHYVYAVLYNPAYREKYAQNLKREFPRVPLYGKSLKDFECWASWGAALMGLHIGYEMVEPFALQRVDIAMKTADESIKPKAKLKADKDAGKIIIDEVTTLSGIPPEAWAYKLGNRSALEWVLDQYKESKPKDPTIREKFDTYRFADYKDHVIDLLKRVCAVSLQTQAIVEHMAKD